MQNEDFGIFVSNNYKKMEDHFSSQIKEIDEKEQQKTKGKKAKNKLSSWYSISTILFLSVLFASVAGLILISFIKQTTVTNAFKYSLLGVVVLALLGTTFSITLKNKYKLLEKSQDFKKIDLAQNYDFIFNQIDMEFISANKEEVLPWANFGKNFNDEDSEKPIKYARELLTFKNIKTNDVWKIQEIGFGKNEDEKPHKMLLFEGKIENLKKIKDFSMGYKSKLAISFESELKEKWNEIDKDLNLFSNDSNVGINLNKIKKEFAKYGLNNNNFGIIVDSKAQKIYEWLEIKNSLFEIKESANPIVTILNHIFLIKELINLPVME